MPVTNYAAPITPKETKTPYADFTKMDVIVEEKRGRPSKTGVPEAELSETELKLIEGLRDGTTSFDTVQREVAARAFEKILKNPSSLKVKDWLQSELIKIKKEESQAKIGAMEIFLRKMFSGNLPLSCPKCGAPLFTGAVDGEVVHESQHDSGLFPGA